MAPSSPRGQYSGYPPRISLARTPTPLVLLQRASQKWGQGKRIWIKRDDLTGSTLTGNKVRKLEFLAAHAKAEGLNTLITCGGIQSNHARATANVCAQLGWHCELVLRGSEATPEGNTLLDALFGAELTVVPPRDYGRSLPALLESAAERQRAKGRRPMIIPTGGSDGHGIWGYFAAAEELVGDMAAAGIERACVVAATGSGGTQAGLTLGMAHFQPQSHVVGFAVCDDAGWFAEKVRQDISQAQALYPQLPQPNYRVETNDVYIGEGYGKASANVYQRIVDLARVEGVVTDPVYTGKAFYGLTEELKNDRLTDIQDIIFVHTGGVFGIFPHAPGFCLTDDFSLIVGG